MSTPVCEVDHEARGCLPRPQGQEVGQGLDHVHDGLLPGLVSCNVNTLTKASTVNTSHYTSTLSTLPSSTMTASDTRPMPVPALEKKSLSGPQGEVTARSSLSLSHQNPVSGSLQTYYLEKASIL